MSGLVLDAGALIALERNERFVAILLARTLEHKQPVLVPAGVIGQVWRDGRRQPRLARLLSARGLTIEPLDDHRARTAGQLCGVTKTADVIDASVVLAARAGKHTIVTSDPDDLARLDPRIPLIRV